MGLLYALGILTLVDTALATRCLQCTDMPVPFGCNTVVDCSANEQCFLQQYVTSNGLVMYDMGCLPSQRCSSRKRSGDVVTCLRCCQDDYCNIEGCGSTPGDLSKRGPKCFNCPSSVSPESCRHTQNCDADQMCGLIHSTPTWTGRCLAKVQCSAIASISTRNPGCGICCAGDLCNDRCRNTTANVGILTVAPATGVKCLQCADVPHPFDCDIVTTCSQDDQCFIEGFVTSAGALRFKSGCMSKQRCSTGKRGNIYRRDSSVTVCRDCCHGSFCNTEGCGATANPRPNRGPKCFNCRAQRNPGECRDTTTCSVDEVCALFKTSVAGTTWKSSCMGKTQCDIIARLHPVSATLVGKKRATQPSDCVLCCHDDFCNADCQNSSHVTRSQSTTHTHGHLTPTTHAPTTTTATPHVPSLQDICPRLGYHYDRHSGLCYKFHYDHRTWADANNVCKREGGSLAVIDNRVKMEFLEAKLKADHSMTSHRIYIGGFRHNGTNRFYWVNGRTVTLNNWAHGQPSNAKGEDCIALTPTNSFLWHDVICYQQYSYICTVD